MLDAFKKSFSVPYEEMETYPTRAKAMEAITKYCEENGDSCTFIGEDEVEISGIKYRIYRGVEPLNLGYGIICKEE